VYDNFFLIDFFSLKSNGLWGVYSLEIILMKFFILAFLGLFASIFAQADSPPYTPPGANLKPNMDTFSFDVGINRYNRDTYLFFNPMFNLDFDNKWGVSFQVPLNILVNDEEPKFPKSKSGMLRPGDYSTREDYQRILNFFWIGQYGVYKPGKINWSVYAGRMFNGYIGHGTIINRYINNQRIDYYKVGVMADINTDYGGAQVFTNSVSDKEVNAARIYIRPYGLIMGLINLGRGESVGLVMQGNVLDEAGRKKVIEEIEDDGVKEKIIVVDRDPNTGELKEREKEVPKKRDVFPTQKAPLDTIWNRFAIGYTSAYDGKAPSELDFDTTGNLKYTKDNQPQVKRTKRVGIEGYDAEFKVINWDWLELTPYYDYNRFRNLDNARGRHIGVIFKIGNKKMNLTVTPEYRNMSSNYIPMYFDSFYEIERYQTNLANDFPNTKQQYLQNLNPDGKDVRGYFHTAILNINKLGFEINYEDYQGKDNARIFAGLYIPIGSMFRLSGFYTKKGFDRPQEAFKVDDRSTGAGEVAVNLGPVTVKLQNRRRWVFDETLNKYRARDEQMFLFSGGFSF
jgi:hypothetical protein